jgi:hypothetical protein
MVATQYTSQLNIPSIKIIKHLLSNKNNECQQYHRELVWI